MTVTAAREWDVWTTTARVVVTEPEALEVAVELVRAELAAVDAVASRFRPDSEISRRYAANDGRPATVSPMLADLVGTALAAAALTGGAVDPTVGTDLVALGYPDGRPARASLLLRPGVAPRRRGGGWRDVRLVGDRLVVPAGVLLDLGATGKARTADRCAELVAERLGCGVLVSLGGDLRVAGPDPAGGWQIRVQDGPDEPASRIRLDGARALASSSTLHRTWRDGTARRHHIVDPATGRPAPPVWRTVSVAAASCALANAWSTATIVRAEAGLDLLRGAGVTGRVVDRQGRVIGVGGWPTQTIAVGTVAS